MAKYSFDQIAINSTTKKKPAVEDKYTYIGLEHLDTECLEVTRWGSEVDITGEKLVMKKGDVLFGRRNTYLRRAAIAPHDGIFSAHGMVLRPRTEVVLPEFFPFFIASDYFMNEAIKISVGSLSPTVNWKDLAKLEFDIPSLSEQKRLAEVLLSIEDTLQAYKKLLNETDNMVRSQFIEMFGTPKENTKGFAVGKIGDVVSDVHYGTSSKASDSGDYTYLRMNNISYEGELDLSETKRITVSDKELKGCLVKKGDVIFNRTNSRDLVGKTCAFSLDEPMVIAGYLIRLRLNGKVLPEYLATFMNLKSSKKMLMTMAKGAVGQANINSQEVQSIELVIPPLELQEEFVVLLDQSNKSKCVLKDAISALEATKKSLMRDTFGC